jgi:hypothetical protein
VVKGEEEEEGWGGAIAAPSWSLPGGEAATASFEARGESAWDLEPSEGPRRGKSIVSLLCFVARMGR